MMLHIHNWKFSTTSNLEVWEFSCFCVSVVPFSRLVFSNMFFSGNLFLTSVFKIFFLMAAYFGHSSSDTLTWPFYTFLGGSGCVCVCVCLCLWLTPYFPDAVLHWLLPDVILWVSYHFDILGLLLHLLFHFLKRPGWFSWRSMTLSTGLWFDNLLRGFDFLGLWFRWLGLVDAVLFLLEVYGVVVRSFLLLVF